MPREPVPEESASVTDAFGLTLTTTRSAAAAYRRGVVDLLAGRTSAAERSLTDAVVADPRFALGHAALAATGEGEIDLALERARALAGGASRRERQHVEVIDAAVRGDTGRALALAHDHLTRFPCDVLVLHAVARAVAPLDNQGYRRALGDLVAETVPLPEGGHR